MGHLFFVVFFSNYLYSTAQLLMLFHSSSHVINKNSSWLWSVCRLPNIKSPKSKSPLSRQKLIIKTQSERDISHTTPEFVVKILSQFKPSSGKHISRKMKKKDTAMIVDKIGICSRKNSEPYSCIHID